MIIIEKRLDVYWRTCYENRQYKERYKIGTLSFDGELYTFKYIDDLEPLREKGFWEILPFIDCKKVYTSKTMFSVFSTRVPEANQIGIEKILRKYDLTEYDAFELLARSGGRTPRDSLEFVRNVDNDKN